MKFEKLASSIKDINDKAGTTAKSVVNRLMTLRNWAIGYYIVEYEQTGSDRAEYGTQLFLFVVSSNWCDGVETI